MHCIKDNAQLCWLSFCLAVHGLVRYINLVGWQVEHGNPLAVSTLQNASLQKKKYTASNLTCLKKPQPFQEQLPLV